MFNYSAGAADVDEQGSISFWKGAIKTRSFGLAVLALFLCSSLQYAYADDHDGRHKRKKQFVSVNSQIVEVQGAIASLQDQLNALVARVTTLEERVTADEVAIGTLQSQNLALQALAAQNLTDITAIQNEVLTLQGQNAYLLSLIGNGGDTSALQAEIDANTALITTLQQAILLVQTNVIDLTASLQAQIDDNLVLITALQGEIDMINSDLAFKDKLLGGTCPSGEAATAIQADGSLVCGPFGSGTGGTQEITEFNVIQLVNMAAGASSGNIYTGCPAGSVAVSSGIAGADRVKINRLFVAGWFDVDTGAPLSQSSGIMRVVNTDSLPTFAYHIVNCMQFTAPAP